MSLPVESASRLTKKDLKGSRLRCLMLANQPRDQVAHFLNSLANPHAVVQTSDFWMPMGFQKPEEAKLGETVGFLSDVQREAMTDWWLAIKERANTPNWDIASTCTIENKRGLILVEAKAHNAEFKNERKQIIEGTNRDNHERIKEAIEMANKGLKRSLPGWSLSRDSNYQLSNRFAWAWMLASLGVPVVLVYLGFLNVQEMDTKKNSIFTTLPKWQEAVLDRAKGTVPAEAWNRRLDIDGIPIFPLIRAADVNISTSIFA
jgi:hypothetical protein